jgi:hypothetical protein
MEGQSGAMPTIHLNSYDRIAEAASSGVDPRRRKSLVCFAPRLAGKTKAYEQTRQKVESLFREIHDIGPSSEDAQKLLELVTRVPDESVLVMAPPYATEWACRKNEIKSLGGNLLPIEITEAEAEAILWACSESKQVLNRALDANERELLKAILKHSRSEFKLFGTKGTTYRPALIQAHVTRMGRERKAWTRSDEAFIKHSKSELDDRRRRIESYLGATALLAGDAGVGLLTKIFGGPVAAVVGAAAAAAGANPLLTPATLVLVSGPILLEILSRAKGDASKVGELADWADFWNRMEAAEREVFAEHIDAKRRFDPGTSYEHLARIFGDTKIVEDIGDAVDDWFDRNAVEVAKRVTELVASDSDFRQFVQSTVHEEVDQYLEQIERDRARRIGQQQLREMERSCLYGFLTPIDQLDWRSLYPPQESGVISERPMVPRYVERTVDETLRQAIRDGLSTPEERRRLVVVSGESKVGKTRTLLEALSACCPDARLLWVRPPDQSDEKPPLSVIADDWDTAINGGLLPTTTLVLVLDDLQYHTSVRTSSITYSALSLLARQPNVLIVATCQPAFLRLDPADRSRGIPQADPEVVRWANERAIWLEAELDRAERARAIDTFADAVLEERVTQGALGRLAETLASVDQLVARYKRAAADPQYAHRAAVVEAAVDHWVLMPGFAVAEDLLIEFAMQHFRERFPTRGWRGQFTADAIDWATEPLGHIHAILQDMTANGAPVLRLHDGVASRLAASWRPAGWLLDLSEKLPHIAQFNVGLFLEGQGRRDEAEAWYRLMSESDVTSTSARRLMASYFM